RAGPPERAAVHRPYRPDEAADDLAPHDQDEARTGARLMSVRACIPYADRRLHRPAAPVEAVTDEIRAIWADMIDTMEAMPGVGLAAPQIGVMLRLAVVDASAERGQ